MQIRNAWFVDDLGVDRTIGIEKSLSGFWRLAPWFSSIYCSFFWKVQKTFWLLMYPSPLPDAFRVLPLLLVAWSVMITSLFMDLFSYIVGTLKTFSILTFMSFRYGELSWIMSLILFSPPYSLFPIYGTLTWLLADLKSSRNFIIFSLLFSTSLL